MYFTWVRLDGHSYNGWWWAELYFGQVGTGIQFLWVCWGKWGGWTFFIGGWGWIGTGGDIFLVGGGRQIISTGGWGRWGWVKVYFFGQIL